MEGRFGSEAIVLVGNALHRNFDLEFPAEGENFKFQCFVVFLDRCGPYDIAEFDSFGLYFDRRGLQEFVGNFVGVHMPFFGNGYPYGKLSAVFQCARAILHLHIRRRHRVHIELLSVHRLWINYQK